MNRRTFIKCSGTLALGSLLTRRGGTALAAADTVTLPFENGLREMAAYPQKRRLIVQTSRPPQLETPFSVFDESPITPNDAFFVRYHLAGIPTNIDGTRHRLKVHGHVRTPLNLSMADLKAMAAPVEIVAVNQCSGNGRGFFIPRVAGGQSGNGAMGNARWFGVSLKKVLEKAGLPPDARQVVFRGLDHPVLDATPAFAKALDIDHALDGEVMLAYAMNGADLPMLNGFPLRLVVPGYYGTYWVKHLSDVEVLDQVFSGYWMSKAYRVPANPTHSVAPGTTPSSTVPIGRFNVRSFITNLQDGSVLAAGRKAVARGIAFDGGTGIRRVDFSYDGGHTSTAARLGAEIGRYSFREWWADFTPTQVGPCVVMARATSRGGEVQPLEPRWNPAGYMRNVVERVNIRVT